MHSTLQVRAARVKQMAWPAASSGLAAAARFRWPVFSGFDPG
jgi:hypothetical protein